MLLVAAVIAAGVAADALITVAARRWPLATPIATAVAMCEAMVLWEPRGLLGVIGTICLVAMLIITIASDTPRSATRGVCDVARVALVTACVGTSSLSGAQGALVDLFAASILTSAAQCTPAAGQRAAVLLAAANAARVWILQPWFDLAALDLQWDALPLIIFYAIVIGSGIGALTARVCGARPA